METARAVIRARGSFGHGLRDQILKNLTKRYTYEQKSVISHDVIHIATAAAHWPLTPHLPCRNLDGSTIPSCICKGWLTNIASHTSCHHYASRTISRLPIVIYILGPVYKFISTLEPIFVYIFLGQRSPVFRHPRGASSVKAISVIPLLKFLVPRRNNAKIGGYTAANMELPKSPKAQ